MRRTSVICLVLLLACRAREEAGQSASGSAVDARTESPAADVSPASSAPQDSIDLSWWPASQSLRIALPLLADSALLSVTTVGPHPCQGAIIVGIELTGETLYRDTVRWSSEDECSRLYVRNFSRTLDVARTPQPDTTWTPVESVVNDQQRALYGPRPAIIVYPNGWESSRAIIWNPQSRRFDILVPEGMW